MKQTLYIGRIPYATFEVPGVKEGDAATASKTMAGLFSRFLSECARFDHYDWTEWCFVGFLVGAGLTRLELDRDADLDHSWWVGRVPQHFEKEWFSRSGVIDHGERIDGSQIKEEKPTAGEWLQSMGFSSHSVEEGAANLEGNLLAQDMDGSDAKVET